MGKVFKLIVFMLFLAVIGVNAALWHQLQQAKDEVKAFHQHLMQEMHSQKTATADTELKLKPLQDKLAAQENAIASLSNQIPKDDHAWKAAEVVYLVRMANLQLNVQHDIPNALFLLRQAQNHLNTLHDPAFDSFQAELMKNISLLQSVPALDKDTLMTQLSNLRDEVPNLSILVSPKPNTSIVEQTSHEAHKKWWHRAWNNIKASFKQLVVVRHQDDEIPALMSPEQQIYLQENLQLLIMQAQWALLNHDANLYQNSLKLAKSWVEKYYVQNSADTQQFLKMLAQLQGQNISPKVPDLSQMLSLVHEG